MDRQEHLLTIVAEECAEVHQRCSKALRFGMQETQPEQPHTNENRILQEFNDLAAAMEMLFECPVQNLLSPSEISTKKAKVEKFLRYSLECGSLQLEQSNTTTNA